MRRSRSAPNGLLHMWPVSKRVNVSGRGEADASLIERVSDATIAEGQMFKRQRMNHFKVATTADTLQKGPV